ncbi:heterodisulfide reductase-related iron-sulfur binding cluster [Turicimonas muris]|uniref:FeS-binding protein n=20 Tax=Turicimonas muris TaxID=1796652 RepID=A0A227KDE7_9BURK|nr:(Fe-S)-binding protein [Turicimonas muris]ANU65676.1 FeS-binding protein [Burkholderiales bacterium YL45]OXE45510.1 FeS-binding protein [Turicimonas muris]QQQ96825.1 (Fe-S)-binding protein [Turicimonas muris]
MDIVTRPGFWNIPVWAIIAIYVLGLTACVICGLGIYKSYLLWKAGKPFAVDPETKRRWGFIKTEALRQKRITRKPLGSWLHFWIFWGFVFLFFGTVIAVLDWDIGKLIFGQQFLAGGTYYFYKFVLDIAGVVCLIGLGMAFYRRFVKGGKQFEKSGRFLMILGSLALIIITGYIVEALRLAAEKPEYAVYSPIGNFLATVFYSGMSQEQLHSQHFILWLFHGIIALIFVALIPSTYFAHMYKSPTSIYWQKTKPRGNIPRIAEIEEQESFGISKFNQFNWQFRLNFDACTECGRCTAVCPVNRAGGPLDPREIILSLKKTMHGDYKTIDEPLIGNAVSKDALLACTTCGACVEQCPSRIEIGGAIMQMRRSIAMEEGHFAPGVAKTLQNISSVGNPWGLDPDERFKWAEGLDVPFAKEGEHYDLLYWVGCSASYDKRNQKIAKAMIKILKASGLSFAVMQEESCNAELARRVGEEYLFECQTLMNIENLRKYTFSRIVAHCPHCFNTLKNDFPDYEGGKFNVISHVRFIAEQLDAGRLPLVNDGTEETFAIHDACYLARYNQIINAPRFIIDKIKNLDYVNPKEWGCNTTCCGAGGGQFWSENDKGERLNVIRLKAIVNDTGAKNIATSCPFCLSMFDSAKSQDTSLSEIQLSDIAEIVAKHIK